jgi:hypothetical protein
MVKRRANDREDAATAEEREARVDDMIARARRAHQPVTRKRVTKRATKAKHKR